MASSRRELLARALRDALALGLTKTARLIFRAIKGGLGVDLTAAEVIISAAEQRAIDAALTATEGVYTDILQVRAPNRAPLRSLLQERRRQLSNAFQGYRFLYRQSADNLLTIGRRTQDILREMTLEGLERSLIAGEPSHMLRREFMQSLLKKGVLTNENAPERELRRLREEFFEKVPVFRKDGKLKMFLLNKNNEFMAFDAQYYADLVAITTTDEAREVATTERARNIGTRFVKFNSTGKPKRAYQKDQDPVCAAIDGQVFAIVKETQQAGRWGAIGQSGKFYLHVDEVIKGGFVKPHPFCRHYRSPHPEAAA